MITFKQSLDSNKKLNGVKVYLGKEFELCESCRFSDNYDYYTSIFETCEKCKLKLMNEAGVEEVFYLMRIWKPEMQKKMNILIDLVSFFNLKLLFKIFHLL
jgi:hypothetical protein